MSTLAIKIAGPAGAGVMVAGEVLAKALGKIGYYSLVYPEYPSRIRGGDNNIQLTVSSKAVNSIAEKVDWLITFTDEGLEEHKKEVREGGRVEMTEEVGIDQLVREKGGESVKNSAIVGYIWGALGLEEKAITEELIKQLGEKEELVEKNLEMVKAGYGLGKREESHSGSLGIRILDAPDLHRDHQNDGKGLVKESLTGNEALTKGMLTAGLGFAAIYPMTPINSILAMLTKEKTVTLFRPEDEIAGILAAIGASYAGKRAMVATSGGGFSLMVEGLGLAGIAEIPLVVVLGQRTGPSSGMATFSSQADLNFAINAGHGEFPRIVLAPGDLRELYQAGIEAFNLADRYQIPVIVLTDKLLAESRFTVDEGELERVEVAIDRWKRYGGYGRNGGNGRYRRYEVTADGISPRAVPGETVFFTNSYEHNEKGLSDDGVENRKAMMIKREAKLQELDEINEGAEVYGSGEADITLVTWGSTKGVGLEMVAEFEECNLLHVSRVWPFPRVADEFIRRMGTIIVIEGNFSGQLAGIIEQKTGRSVERITKDDGRPFYREELKEQIDKIIKRNGVVSQTTVELVEEQIVIKPDREI